MSSLEKGSVGGFTFGGFTAQRISLSAWSDLQLRWPGTWIPCNNVVVVQSFADAATEDLFNGRDSKAARAVDKALWPVVRRMLDMVNAAGRLDDLRAPSGNRLEALKGDQKGRHSIRVNEKLRITFRFESGNAHDVRCEDDH